MSVPILFALLGSIILVGFLANLLFRLTKIPSVLVLIAIGVVLGPVTGWIRHDALLTIAPYFGAIALLVILFEGGLELDVAHVLRHAPRTTLFTVVVFGLSMATATAVGQFGLGLPPSVALMLGAILGATSPAICIPVVSGLSIREDVKTVVKLEAAFGEVLLLVSVVLLLQGHEAGTSDASSWIWGFARSLAVALVVATIAGVVWSRLVAWMGREPLSYMLTLGITCLLYFVVEELGGSPAIAVLLFGLLLANMQYIAGRVGPHLREAFGIHVKDDQFVLNQFMVNITAELSFLVRTFFFVYLGLLLNFSELTITRAAWLVVIFLLLLASRRVGIWVFQRIGATFSAVEWQSILALQPRGLGTAVVAFMPIQAGVEGASDLPLYAFALIVLSNVYMTVGVVFAERRIRAAVDHERSSDAASTSPPIEPALREVEEATAPTESRVAIDTNADRPRSSQFSPARAFEGEPLPATLADWLARASGLRLADRELVYGELLRSAYFAEPLFWIQSALGASICALGLLLGQTPIVIGACLIVPVARPVLTTGLALAAGDLYLLLKLVVKLGAFSVVTILVSMWLAHLAPLSGTLREIVVRTHPTILDFLVSLFGGISAAALVVGRRTPVLQYLPGAVVVMTLVPALCVVGFALTDPMSPALVRQAALQFSTNLFAAILGAAIVLVSLGIHRAVDGASIRQWKAEELRRPFARAIFSRLGVEEAIGGTGSVRARVVVVAVFLLLILTPLQLAFNDIRAELRIRQAVTAALDAFNVANRSVIVGSSVNISEERIDVRLQLATTAPFSVDERSRFEARVRRETGRDVRLDLVQAIADVGDASALRMVLQETSGADPAPGDLHQALRLGVEQLKTVLSSVSLPGGAEVIGVDSQLHGARGPTIELRYLSARALDADASALLTSLLSAQTGVPPERTTVTWVSSSHEMRLTDRGLAPSSLDTLRELRARGVIAASHLSVALVVGERVARGTTDSARQQIQEALGLPQLPAVTTATGGGRSAFVTLQRGEL